MYHNESKFQIGFGGGITPAVRNLLIANCAIFILQKLFLDSFLLFNFSLQPLDISHKLKLYQMLTYMFLHGNFFHLFFNMFALWIFGIEVERTLGTLFFYRLFFLTGFGAAILQLLFNWGTNSSIYGASGAVYGIVTAFAILFPERMITLLLFFIIPIHMKAKIMALLFIGISLVLGMQGAIWGTSDGVAHFAHLGGALTAFLIFKSRNSVQYILKRISKYQQQQRETREAQRLDKIKKKRKQVDTILDRINQVGYANISKEEKEFLKEASEFLSQEDINN